MPSPNFPNPENIPDMSLDDGIQRPPTKIPSQAPPSVPEPTSAYQPRPAPVEPTPRSAPNPEPELDVGDRVLAPWEPTFLYPGVIKEITPDARGDQALIRYDDGGEGWVYLYSVSRITVNVGEQVQVRRQGGSQYTPAEIESVEGDRVRVRYDDDRLEFVPVSTLRIPCAPESPGAVGTQLAPWQNPPQFLPADGGGSGIPGWVWTIGLIILFAFLRVGCRMMAQN